MNTKFLATALIAAAGFAAAPSFAAGNYAGGEVGYVPAPAVSTAHSNVTRAEVRNEYLQAERNDTLPPTGEGADVGAVVASTNSTLTRAAVRADTIYALQHGLKVGGEV